MREKILTKNHWWIIAGGIVSVTALFIFSYWLALAGVPANPSSLAQYGASTSTTVNNGDWVTNSTVNLKATSTDTDPFVVYYQLLTSAGTLTTATTSITKFCASGSAFSSCSNNIWANAAITTGWAAAATSYKYRQPVTVLAAQVKGTLTNFPIYLDLARLGTTNPFWAGTKRNSDGGDILITNSTGTQLPVEVVSISTSSKTGEVYFNADSISSSSNIVFYLYYGSSTAAQPAAASTFGSQKVWSNNYVSVYHLNNSSFNDSVGNFNGTNVGTVATTSKFGGANGARAFDGATTGINLGNMTTLTNMTLDAWEDPRGTQVANAKILAKTITTAVAPYSIYNLTYDASTPILLRTEIDVAGTQYGVTGTSGAVPSTYSFVASTYDGANLRFYFNGAAQGTPTAIAGSLATNADPTQIGRSYFGGTAIKEWFKGAIDEVRIATVARPVKWISTQYNNMNSAGTFFSTTSVQQYYLTNNKKAVMITSLPESTASTTGYKWQSIACDSLGVCSKNWTKFNAAVPNFKVDYSIPPAPGALTLTASTTNSITLHFGATTTEASGLFRQYKIYYRLGTSTPIHETDSLWASTSDPNLKNENFNHAVGTTITGLSFATRYSFSIWAYDWAGNKSSSTLSTGISAGNPVPTTVSISPNIKTVGDSAFTLTVKGTNFVASSVVQFNGTALTTGFSSSTQLTATIPSADMKKATNTVQITVFNPTPYGGTSNAQTFTVNNPVPTTVSISPATKIVSDAQFTMTIKGTNFVTSSVAQFNGVALATTFASTTQLTATIPSTYTRKATTSAQIKVFNATPGGGTSNAQTFTVNYPVPTTSSVSPNTKTVMDAQFTMTINGTNFVTSSVAQYNGSALATTFVSPTQVTAIIPSIDLHKATNTVQITVFNSTPGGGTSNAQTFTVNNPVPTTVSISPSSKTVMDAQFTMTIKGTNFVTSSVAQFNGAALTTTFSSSTQLTATIPSIDMHKATNTVQITVFNATPGGGTSNAQTFTVNNPAPTTSSILPNTKNVMDAQFTMTIKGTNFVTSSVAQFNGSALATTFSSSTQLTATIPSIDMHKATNTVQITVFNATPGGGTSNAQTFTVNNPAPTTVSISPNSKTVMDAQFIMTIKGTNFVTSSIAQFNGSALATTFSSSTQLTATIPSIDMHKATNTAQITVFNATPGGGTSNAQTFTINNPVPTTVSISPSSKTVGDGQFIMTIKGTNFVTSSIAQFNGSALTTAFSSSTQVTATIPATDLLTATNTVLITVFNATPGGGTSNSQTFTVNNPVPVTTSISPTFKTVGDAQFTLTVNGSNFVNTSKVRFNGSDRITTFVNAGQLTATIPATDLLTATDTVQITVFNPTPGGGTSNAQTFTVNNPVPTTVSISPNTKTVGDAQFTMTIKGTNFVSTSQVQFNGSNRTTTFASSTQLTAVIPATDMLKATNTAQITVVNPAPGGGTSNAQTFTVNNPVPATTSISPTFKTVGDAQFTLTVNGANFVNTSVVRFNGSDRTTTFVNSGQLTAIIPATDLLIATTSDLITVFNPAPGGGTSNAQTFTVNNPVPVTTSISPTFKTVGDAQFTLTVNGSNFVNTSQVRFNGSDRATTFVSAGQLTATIPASDLLTATTTVQITVFNPTPGGGTSNAQTFTVNNPVPVTTSISPTFKTVGDAQFTLTVNGSNFVNTSVVKFNGSNRTTTFVNSGQLTATIPATDLLTATDTVEITVFNPAPGGGTSNAQTFTVNNPVPVTTSISPTFKTVGDAQFTLTVNGSNFVATSKVRFNGSDRATTFVNSGQLTATIPATDLLTATDTVQITVFNPAPGGGTSNAQTFTVNNPVPVTNNISPTFKTVGDAQFTLTVNGSEFVNTSVVRFNGSDRATTFVSAGQLTATIPATDLLAATTTAQITVFNPAPGGGTSNAQTFTVNNPVPVTTSISPTFKTVGDAQFTLTVNGTNFVSTSKVRFNGSDRTTAFVSAGQLTAIIPATDLTTATDTVQITVFNPTPGGGTSNAQTFTVNNPVPTTASISPSSKTVGDAQFTMTVKGTKFVNNSVVRFNGSDRATTFSSSTQLTAIIPAGDMLTATDTVQITVFNPAPGGGTSNAQTFTVNNRVPTTVSISPSSKIVGDAQFTMTVKGTNFVNASVVRFNGSDRVTTFSSSTQLTATIPATDLIAATNTVQITVFNPTPGGGTSNAQTFTVNNPVPVTTSISPTFKTVGDAQFTLTVNGSNFVNTSVVKFNGSSRATTFVNSGQLTAIIPATYLLTATDTVEITVFNTGPGGGTSNAQTFTVNNRVPTTVSISPSAKTVGDAQFTMTVKGTNFVNTSVVRFNGSDRVTTFSSSTQLTATISASDLLTATTSDLITVFNPAPGGGTSNAQTFTVNNRVPTTVSISPSSKTVGDAQFTLTVKGTNFVSNSVVRLNGSDRSTSFSSSTQLTATIPSTDLLAATDTVQITVFNPAPGGGTSNAQTFTVNNPVPVTNNISPTFKTVGDAQFTLTVNGSNFVNTSVVRFNGSDRTTTFVNAGQLTAIIPATDLLTATTSDLITVFNPAPGGGTSNAQAFTVNNPAPTTTSISPTFKTAGDAQFTLTVNGSNFVSNSVVKFNGSNRATTYVSSGQLTAIIPSSDLTTATDTIQITVFNPAPGGGISNAQIFTVNNPVPVTTSISPTFKTVGDTQFTLTVNGSNFVATSKVRFNGSDRATTFVNSGQLTATIPATDLLTATDTVQITVFNPVPGGGTSNAQTFTVNNPVPVTTSISPTFKTVGDAQFTLTVNGSDFVNTSVVRFNGSDRATTFVSAGQLTAIIPATDLLTATTSDLITVFNPAPGGGTSNSQTFTVNNLAPVTTSISPTFKTVGDTQFTLTVNGSNFSNNSIVRFNGSDRSTTYVSASQLTAIIPATDLLTATDTAQITVFNPAPGGGTSNAQTFTVNNPVPVTNNISPTFKTVGDAQFTLTVNGSNFVGTSKVRFNGSDRATTFVSAGQLTAIIPATDLLTATTSDLITVFNPAPGGGTSNAQTFTVNNPVPVTTSISPTFKTVGDAQFSLTVNGSDFVSDSVVKFNGASRTTTFVSSAQLTATIPASDLLAATTTVQITVFNPAPGGGTSNAQTFTVNNPVPVTTSISPTFKTVGDPQFTLTVNGSKFVNSSVVRFNGSDRSTSYVSGSKLTAIIPATDLTVVTSTVQITVFNPAPGGGTSNAQTFTVTTTPQVATKFVIIQPADGTVDGPITVTVEVQDSSSVLVGNYQQDVTLVTNGSATGGGLVNIVNGVGTTTISDHVAETVHLSLSDTEGTGLDVSSTKNVTFAAGVPAAFTLNNPGNITAGTRAAYIVTRHDQYGNLTGQGNSTVYLYTTSNGSHASFYDSAVNGNLITSVSISNGNTSVDFWYYDEKSGSWTVTASDNSLAPDGNAGIDDATDAITVSPGSTSEFTLTNPGGMTAGTRQGYAVGRQDQFGNAVTAGNQTVYLYSNSSGANHKFYNAFVAGSVITSATIGSGASSTNFWYYDEKAGNWTITASDNSSAPDGLTGIIDASVSVSVSAAATYQYLLNDPGDMTQGTLLGYIVTREDQFNNLVTVGTDRVYLYSNSNPISPIFYATNATSSPTSSVSIINGASTANFWYFDRNVGSWTVTGSDNASSPDGASGIIDATDAVNVLATPIVATKFIIIDPTDGTAGDNISVTVKAVDNNNNVDASYQNDVSLLTSGSASGGGLVDIVHGVGTMTITDTVAETVNLSLSDTQGTGLDISSTQNVIFAPGPVYKFILSNPGGITAGTRAGYTVIREDQYSNLITAGNTTVYLYSDSSGVNKKFYDAATAGSVISLINISPGNSAANFWYYDDKSGNWKITVSDNSSAPDGAAGVFDAQDVLAVSPDAVFQFTLSDPGDMSAGTRLGYQVFRKDQFANLVTVGSNIVYLYSNSTGTTTKFYDAAVAGSIITSLTLTSGSSTADFWYFDNTSGTWTITASDNSSAPDGAAGINDGTDDVTVSSAPVIATKFVILNPVNGTVGDHITVTVEAQNNAGNIDTSYQHDVTLNTSGSASGGGLVDIVNGIGTKVITDAVAETVNLSLTDSQSTGLNISSVQNVIFAPAGGPPPVNPPVPQGGGQVSKPLVFTVTGQAFDQAQISLSQVTQQGANLVKTTNTAAADGTFSITATGFSPGSYVFSLAVKDQDGRTTQARIFNVSFSNLPVEVDNVFIPPTVSLLRSVLTRGDFIKVMGYAAPDNEITVLLENGLMYSVKASISGYYQILINTAALPYGVHGLKVKQTDHNTGIEGEYSLTKNFIVSAVTVPTADFNHDGKIDIQDWSIFLSLFQNQGKQADFNNDGKVDISDLSIFLQAAKIK